jgi:peptide/nickel transport system ATP-binding protein
MFESLQDEFGLTYVFIAHDLNVVRHVSDRVAVMYLGSLVEISPADELYAKPLHPYTMSLLEAVPIPDPDVEAKRKTVVIPGELPSPVNPPSGCRFHTRCPYRQPTKCHDQAPPLRPFGDSGHMAACHWVEEIQAGQITPHIPEAGGEV